MGPVAEKQCSPVLKLSMAVATSSFQVATRGSEFIELDNERKTHSIVLSKIVLIILQKNMSTSIALLKVQQKMLLKNTLII
jgi:hypothetical protein